MCVGLLLTGIACSKKPAGKRYELQGRVVAVDSGSREITVAHQDIPGLMPGMTMPFPIARDQDWVFGKIGPGDHIHATLVMTDHAELQDISFTQGSDTGSDGTSNLRIPEIGDDVPDFTLVNQFGKTIHLDQFRGKPLLLTFIYTRCPVPDFCLLMSNNFSAVLKELQKNPAVFAKAQLLSISIDPNYDTPIVLQSYGKRYVGDVDPGFHHWQFASGSPEEVRKAADFFGLSYNEKQGQIVHTLQTVVIGADGKIAKVYTGNQWKPDEVAAEYEAAASH
ncbi:MAG TPA: SCO family protein [Candidatus Limnocylindrales bacterium]|nr:SCO family protein [Candidatus Limnocylindrales bacterium]